MITRDSAKSPEISFLADSAFRSKIAIAIEVYFIVPAGRGLCDFHYLLML